MSRYYGFGQENLPVPGSDIRQEPTAFPLMSVDEMGALLGLKKTEQYWLVHKNVFDTRTFVGRIWIVRDSFERWYENQAKYHKVNGEPPGKELRKSSLSAEDIAEMLDITMSTAYEVIKRYELETVTVDHCLRVTKESFDRWYAGQDKYRTREDHKKDEEMLKATVSMPEMARLLGLPRSNVYSILKSRQYGHLLDSRIVAGQKRITWESFDRFLAAQDKYHLYYPADKTGKVPEQNGRLANYRKKIAMNAEDTRPIGTKDYLTVEEAAAMASVTKATIYNWLGRGYFPVKKVGRTARIPRTDFESWQQKTALERTGE